MQIIIGTEMFIEAESNSNVNIVRKISGLIPKDCLSIHLQELREGMKKGWVRSTDIIQSYLC
jgi:hypothetical protein